MTYISFTLSMPVAASWNGHWSGEGELFAIVRKVPDRKLKDFPMDIVKQKWFDYRWEDGWVAAVKVEKVDAKTARMIKRKSRGFYGYDWMIDSIIKNGMIKYED